jgi:hypothetical protein
MSSDNSNDTIVINTEPVEFNWTENNMSSGIIAQEIGAACPTYFDALDTITITGAVGSSGTISTTAGANGTSWSNIASGSTITLSDPYEVYEERLAKLEKIIAEEAEIRKNHPAVQNAYDEYRLLLVLARKNAGDLLTDE